MKARHAASADGADDGSPTEVELTPLHGAASALVSRPPGPWRREMLAAGALLAGAVLISRGSSGPVGADDLGEFAGPELVSRDAEDATAQRRATASRRRDADRIVTSLIDGLPVDRQGTDGPAGSSESLASEVAECVGAACDELLLDALDGRSDGEFEGDLEFADDLDDELFPSYDGGDFSVFDEEGTLTYLRPFPRTGTTRTPSSTNRSPGTVQRPSPPPASPADDQHHHVAPRAPAGGDHHHVADHHVDDVGARSNAAARGDVHHRCLDDHDGAIAHLVHHHHDDHVDHDDAPVDHDDRHDHSVDHHDGAGVDDDDDHHHPDHDHDHDRADGLDEHLHHDRDDDHDAAARSLLTIGG